MRAIGPWDAALSAGGPPSALPLRCRRCCPRDDVVVARTTVELFGAALVGERLLVDAHRHHTGWAGPATTSLSDLGARLSVGAQSLPDASQPANSQCHGSGLLPPGSAHAGCTQPNRAPFACSHRCASLPNCSTPQPRSRATP